MTSKYLLPFMAAAALPLAGCASNYGGEGALVGGVGGALLGGTTGAAVGAAVGAGAGSLIKKNGHCYRRDDRGYEYRVRC